MSNPELPQPDEPDAIEDAKWHQAEARAFADAAKDAADKGDLDRAQELSKKASGSRIKMNIDLFDKLRGRRS